MSDTPVIVAPEYDREPVGCFIVPDMRPVFLIGYGSDKIFQFLFPAGGNDSVTHGRHLLRGGQIGKERGYCVRMGEKNPDYREWRETILEAGKKPSYFGRFMAWMMLPLIAIRLPDSIEDPIFFWQTGIRIPVKRRRER